jgi:hypothetical protein
LGFIRQLKFKVFLGGMMDMAGQLQLSVIIFQLCLPKAFFRGREKIR